VDRYPFLEAALNLQRILIRAYNNPAGLSFREFQRLVEAFGFRLSRINGSHHIYVRPGTAEIVNVQRVHDDAKPYQVRQFLRLVERLGLEIEVGE
jgi:predicted RNA binding protein YcfA (HicA-like mRNA interferase family)